MGAGIAEVCARAGSAVVVVEFDDDAVANGRTRLTQSLDKAVAAGKLGGEDRDAALARVSVSTGIEAFADRQLVIEAVPEIPELKLAAFCRIDAAVRTPDAILTSNTSSIPISRIAAVTARPGQVVGMHFFNPVPVLNLVELVSALRTGAETLERAGDYAAGTLSKKVIYAKDRAGMVNGCAHPMGPLRLTDLVGTGHRAPRANSLYEEFKEPHYAPPVLLMRMVESGMLGRKSGRGFYNYE